jgi:hypothetical protein
MRVQHPSKTKEPSFEELAGILQGLIIHQHGSETGKRDKAYCLFVYSTIKWWK